MLITEILNKMKNHEIDTTSTLDLRNESKQTRVKLNSLPKIKREKNEINMLLVLTEIAIPFDPFTVSVTEEYNTNRKFRPQITTESTILALKTFYNENAEQKEAFLEEAGVSEWDTSDTEHYTNEDKKVFARFRQIRKYSSLDVKIKSKSFTGQSYPCKYEANYSRDEFDNPSDANGEYPEYLKLERLYREIALEQFNVYKAKFPDASEQKLKDQYSAYMKSSPLSQDRYTNNCIAVAVPMELDSEGILTPKEDLSTWTDKDVLAHLRRVSWDDDDIASPLKNIITKEKISDIYPSFLELQMTVLDEKTELGYYKATFASPKVALSEIESKYKVKPFWEQFNSVVTKAIDGFENLEMSVKKAMTYNKLNDESMPALYAALEVDVPYKSIEQYITDNIAQRYSDVLDHIYGSGKNAGLLNDKLMEATLGDGKKSTVSESDVEKASVDAANMLNQQADLDFDE